jgi:hypothetical protein
VVPDHQSRARLELDDARGRGRDYPSDASVVIDEQVGQRAGLPPFDVDALSAEVQEGVAPGAIEAELTVEEDERRLDGQAVAQDIAGRERQEAVHAVATPDLEPQQMRKRPIEQGIHGGAKSDILDDDGPTKERAGPVDRLHSAEGMPRARPRQTT